jgi:ATP-dependent DNA helicase PIF1
LQLIPIQACRYRKPEECFEHDTWREDLGKIFLAKKNGMVNNFNIFLTLIVNANTDVQFLFNGNNALEVIFYITNYISKNSVSVDNIYIFQKAALRRSKEQPLQYRPSNMSEIQGNIRDFFIRFFSKLRQETQVCATEIATRLLGLPMVYKSEEFTPLLAYPVVMLNLEYENLPKRSLAKQINKKIGLTRKGKMQLNTVVEYLYRPERLSWINWYDFVTYYEKCDASDAQFSLQDGYPDRNVGLRVRKTKLIPNVYAPFKRRPDEDDATEQTNQDWKQYWAPICILFQPFRSFKDIDSSRFNCAGDVRIVHFMENVELLTRGYSEAKMQAQEREEQLKREENESIDKDTQQDWHEEELNLIEARHDFSDSIDLGDLDYAFLDTPAPDDIFEQMKQSAIKDFQVRDFFIDNENVDNETLRDWNAHSKFLYREANGDEIDHIYNETEAQTDLVGNFTNEHDDTLQTPLNSKQKCAYQKIINGMKNGEQIVMFLTGQGGTGKSQVIKALSETFETKNISRKLKKMAYTASSAFIIGGRTIHSQLQKNKFKKFITPPQRQKLYETWKEVMIMVIDEISFCPGKLIEELDEMLRQVHENNKPFGGVHVIFVGDLKQHLSIKGLYVSSFNFRESI